MEPLYIPFYAAIFMFILGYSLADQSSRRAKSLKVALFVVLLASPFVGVISVLKDDAHRKAQDAEHQAEVTKLMDKLDKANAAAQKSAEGAG